MPEQRALNGGRKQEPPSQRGRWVCSGTFRLGAAGNKGRRVMQIAYASQITRWVCSAPSTSSGQAFDRLRASDFHRRARQCHPRDRPDGFVPTPSTGSGQAFDRLGAGGSGRPGRSDTHKLDHAYPVGAGKLVGGTPEDRQWVCSGPLDKLGASLRQAQGKRFGGCAESRQPVAGER